MRHILISTLLLLAATSAANAEQQKTVPTTAPTVKIGVGYFDALDDTGAMALKVDLRGNQQWFGHIDPFATLSVNDDGGYFGGLGLTGDLHVTPRWVLTPSLAAGLYGRGDSKDLGGPIAFRSGLEFAYKFQNNTRIGLEITHTSNAGIYEDNPGTETITLNYTLPIGWVLP